MNKIVLLLTTIVGGLGYYLYDKKVRKKKLMKDKLKSTICHDNFSDGELFV